MFLQRKSQALAAESRSCSLKGLFHGWLTVSLPQRPHTVGLVPDLEPPLGALRGCAEVPSSMPASISPALFLPPAQRSERNTPVTCFYIRSLLLLLELLQPFHHCSLCPQGNMVGERLIGRSPELQTRKECDNLSPPCQVLRVESTLLSKCK